MSTDLSDTPTLPPMPPAVPLGESFTAPPPMEFSAPAPEPPPVPTPVEEPPPLPSPQDEPNPTLPPTRPDVLSVSLGAELDAMVIRPQDRIVIHLRPHPEATPQQMEERAQQIYGYITTVKGWPKHQVMVVAGPYQLTVFRGPTL